MVTSAGEMFVGVVDANKDGWRAIASSGPGGALGVMVVAYARDRHCLGPFPT